MADWNTNMHRAPYRCDLEVKIGKGMVIQARLEPDASMTDSEKSCDQWVATHEGEHPPCWSEGACWQSNVDEVMSLQPTAWRLLPEQG